MKKIAFQNLLVSTISIIILGIFTEGGVRLFIDNGMQYDLEMWKYAIKLKRSSLNPEQRHEHIPNRFARLMGVDVKINSHGHRDREFTFEKNVNTTRILMLGDSLTLGWGVSYEETVSKYLEKLLNKSRDNKAYELINTGVGNTNTDMQVSYFQTSGINFSPDFVILNYFINDAELTPKRKTHFLSERSYAYSFFAGRWDMLKRKFMGSPPWDFYYKDLYNDKMDGWIRTKAAIRRLADFCQSRGISLVLVNYPELHNLKTYPFKTVNKKIKSLALEFNLPYLDLLPAVEGINESELWVSLTDQHPNGKANILYAKAIHNFLPKSLFK
jgi:lysophospholipase L1-like esterase